MASPLSRHIYVDMDRTLLGMQRHSNIMESIIQNLMSGNDLKRRAFVRSTRFTIKPNMPLNTQLMDWLEHRNISHGDSIIGYTDRPLSLAKTTEANLGKHKDMFSSMIYGGGAKTNYIPPPRSVIIDDSERVLTQLRGKVEGGHFIQSNFVINRGVSAPSALQKLEAINSKAASILPDIKSSINSSRKLWKVAKNIARIK
jgi:hypothetical protein